MPPCCARPIVRRKFNPDRSVRQHLPAARIDNFVSSCPVMLLIEEPLRVEFNLMGVCCAFRGIFRQLGTPVVFCFQVSVKLDR